MLVGMKKRDGNAHIRVLMKIGALCPCVVLPLITQCKSETDSDFLFDRLGVQFDNHSLANAEAFHLGIHEQVH